MVSRGQHRHRQPVSIARTAVIDPEYGVGPLRVGVHEFEV